ncbi:MAG TPA: glycosyltransferase family 2 protein [Kiritimatiellia bacterium]|nr:glycosyltransferase family 2 protein [Kiritimatiellia bacterium]HNS81526.1 glycosyltransferase family 2 protein [Kiritimatiellia bacterium]
MKISIIVPVFNAADSIGRCIESVLGQQGAEVELIVVDGGSTDGTVDIIRRYRDHIAWWVSEPDTGQTSAINKGLSRSTGEVVNWLCADDVLTEGALKFVAEYFAAHPDADLLAGACEMVYEENPAKNFIFIPRADFPDLLPAFDGIMQPSCFWRRRIMTRTPLLDESFHYGMDAELWCRFKSQRAVMVQTDQLLSRFIQSGANKTATGGKKIGLELDAIYRRYSNDKVPLSFWYRHLRYPFELYVRRDRGILRLALLRMIQAAYMAVFMPFYGVKKVYYMSWPA